MMRVFFPELSHFEQPLSGEVCARTEVWKRLLDEKPPDGWGIDVWFLIEAAMAGYQIEEIFLGMSKHNFKGTLFLTLKVQYGPLFIQIEMIAR
jgi:hypothetical protein